jgi:type IV secretion system protein VirB2
MKSREIEVERNSGKRLKPVLSSIIALLYLVPTNVFAGGITPSNTNISGLDHILNNIQSALYAAGACVVTIAIIWAGYKLAFAHSSLHDVAKPFVGAILIGSAATIAAYLLGQ